MPENRTALVVCKAGDEPRTVTIRINTNYLVVCPEWKKCEHHDGPECEELGLREDIQMQLAAKRGGTEGLLKHMLNEDREAFKRRIRRTFRR